MIKTAILLTAALALAGSLVATSFVTAHGEAERESRYAALNAKIDAYHQQEMAVLHGHR